MAIVGHPYPQFCLPPVLEMSGGKGPSLKTATREQVFAATHLRAEYISVAPTAHPKQLYSFVVKQVDTIKELEGKYEGCVIVPSTHTLLYVVCSTFCCTIFVVLNLARNSNRNGEHSRLFLL